VGPDNESFKQEVLGKYSEKCTGLNLS